MKIKHIAAAVAMLAMASGAQAALTNAPATGNGDLVLTVFDAGKSYFAKVSTLRLDDLANGTATTNVYTMTGLTGISFSSAANTTFWSVTAGDTTGGVLGSRLLTTSLGDPNLSSVNGNFPTGASNAQKNFDAAGCAAINPCTAALSTDASYAGDGQAWGQDFGGTGVLSGAFVSDSTSLDLYVITADASAGSASAASFANPVFTKTLYTAALNLAAGTLTLTSAATTAVPLPAAAWLFGSGLSALGLVGRRRRRLTVAA